MTLTIDLTPEQEAALAAEAERTGQTVEEYAVSRIFTGESEKYLLLRNTPSAVDDRTPEEQAEAFRQFQAWLRLNAPVDTLDIPLKYLSSEKLYKGRGEIDRDAPESDPISELEDWLTATGGDQAPAIPLEALSRERMYDRGDEE